MSAEKYVYKNIKEEEKLKKKSAKRTKTETLEKYKSATIKSSESIRIYDDLSILYVWIIELLQIGGYFL